MSIHAFYEEWPEEPETTSSRWDYNIGSKVLFIKQVSESFSLQVRTV